jgi:hypothetical protein
MSDDTNAKPPVETIPGVEGGISEIASAHAPFLYFDIATNFGFNNGIVNVTLETVRYMSAGQKVTLDRVVVAHLRMSIPAASSLKAALDGALLLASPAAGSPASPGGAPRPN